MFLFSLNALLNRRNGTKAKPSQACAVLANLLTPTKTGPNVVPFFAAQPAFCSGRRVGGLAGVAGFAGPRTQPESPLPPTLCTQTSNLVCPAAQIFMGRFQEERQVAKQRMTRYGVHAVVQVDGTQAIQANDLVELTQHAI